MAGRPGGNPNILEISKKSTGPTSEIGKFKSSLNTTKLKIPDNLNRNGDSLLTKMMKEAGVDFSKADKAMEQRNLFVIWAKSKSVKELTEIVRLEQIIQILDTDVSMRAMRKLEKGIPLDEDDVKIIRLLKDCLSTSHELKFGTKKLNVNASYEDIRQMMFDNEHTRSK